MTVGSAKPSIFDAELPELNYDVTDTPQEIYPQFQAAQQVAPIALGPVGPEVLSYELSRTILGDPRFGIPPGIHLTAHGVTSGELWDRVVGSIICARRALTSSSVPSMPGIRWSATIMARLSPRRRISLSSSSASAPDPARRIR